MRVSRRTFVKVALAAGAATVAPPVGKLAAAWAAQRQGMPGTGVARRWVMVVDLSACDGCKKCTRACTEEHFVPFDQEWIKVFQMSNNEYDRYNFPRPCMQCEEAP